MFYYPEVLKASSLCDIADLQGLQLRDCLLTGTGTQDKMFSSLPEAIRRAGLGSKDAIQELSELSQHVDDVGMAADPAVGAMPEVC